MPLTLIVEGMYVEIFFLKSIAVRLEGMYVVIFFLNLIAVRLGALVVSVEVFMFGLKTPKVVGKRSVFRFESGFLLGEMLDMAIQYMEYKTEDYRNEDANDALARGKIAAYKGGECKCTLSEEKC